MPSFESFLYGQAVVSGEWDFSAGIGADTYLNENMIKRSDDHARIAVRDG